MKIHFRTNLFCLLLLSAAAFNLYFIPSAFSAPEVKVSTTYYEITGKSARELRREMNTHGVKDGDGKHFDAHTAWFVRWHFDFLPSGNGCMISHTHVTLDITYLYPKWTEYSATYRDLRTHWDDYLAALKRHEEGHGEIAKQAAAEIEKALQNFKSPSCGNLNADGQRIGDEIIEKYRKIEQDYDRKTKHGKKQGAVFP